MGRSINLEVTLDEVHGDSNRLIRKFIKKIKKMRLMEEIRERRFYVKPSDKRRKEKLRRKENARKAEKERKNKTRYYKTRR